MKTFPTREAFRAALGCAKSTMSRYLSRSDWPVRRSPPWPLSAFGVVYAWRCGLQEDRNWEHERDPDPPATITLADTLRMKAARLRRAQRQQSTTKETRNRCAGANTQCVSSLQLPRAKQMPVDEPGRAAGPPEGPARVAGDGQSGKV